MRLLIADFRFQIFVWSLVYVAMGFLMQASIGGERAALQWEEQPTWRERLVVALFWPFVLLIAGR